MITHLFNSSVVSGPEMLVLPALARLDEPVTIIFLSETRLKEASKKPIEYALKLGLKVYSVEVKKRWDQNAFEQLRRTLDQIKPTLVHAHDVKASFYLVKAVRLAPGFRAPLVSTHHGASARKGIIRLYEEFYVRQVLPRFNSVLAMCEEDRKSLVKRGLNPDRVHLHLNGSDRTFISQDDREMKQRKIRQRWRRMNVHLPAPNEAIFLGAVARLSAEKRHDRMFKVLADLKKSKQLKKRPILLLFGIGPEEKALRELATKLDLDKDVFWMGYSQTIADEMAGFDALLCLSDGEGIPISLLEAGWAATPVFSTAVGGIPNLIPDPKYGFLVNKQEGNPMIAKKLETALSTMPADNSIGTEFQKRIAKEFSQSAWLKRLKEIYRSLPN